jgi:hypothetical protein
MSIGKLKRSSNLECGGLRPPHSRFSSFIFFDQAPILTMFHLAIHTNLVSLLSFLPFSALFPLPMSQKDAEFCLSVHNVFTWMVVMRSAFIQIWAIRLPVLLSVDNSWPAAGICLKNYDLDKLSRSVRDAYENPCGWPVTHCEDSRPTVDLVFFILLYPYLNHHFIRLAIKFTSRSSLPGTIAINTSWRDLPKFSGA